jgi:predicted DNA-binding transcriptional regulator
MEYHIRSFGPTDPWPNGGWSLYQISGDQIADRIEKDEKGKVVARHSWCGYIGIWETPEEITEAIKAHEELELKRLEREKTRKK